VNAQSHSTTEHRVFPADPSFSVTARSEVYKRQKRMGLKYQEGTACFDPYLCRRDGCVRVQTGFIAPYYGVYPPFDSNSYNAKYVSKLEDLSLDISGIVAEIDEAAGLFWDFVKMTASMIRCIRRPASRQCARFLRGLRPKSLISIPAATLQYNFAIKPTVTGVYDILTRLKNPEFSLRRKLKFVHKDYHLIDDGMTSWSAQKIYKTSVVVQMNDNGIWNTNYDVGSPAEWVWERIPFSFVVDWIIPVGRTISAIATLNRFASAAGTVSVKGHAVAHQYGPTGLPVGQANVTLASSFVEKSYRRYLVGLPAVPHFLEIKPPASVTSLVNAVSLLTTMRRSIS
jgi:hypothetical protein